jgi:hypothetical protein
MILAVLFVHNGLEDLHEAGHAVDHLECASPDYTLLQQLSSRAANLYQPIVLSSWFQNKQKVLSRGAS